MITPDIVDSLESLPLRITSGDEARAVDDNHDFVRITANPDQDFGGKYGGSRQYEAYVCTPDRKIQCRLRGIVSFDVSLKGFNDFSSISFTVSKYITNETTYKAEFNDSYDFLHAFCSLYIPNFGKAGFFMIAEEPSVTDRGTNDETKSFTVNSYEAIMQFENLVNFKVNQGTIDSLEMFDGNVDALGCPVRNIQLYDDVEHRLSLLDLILKEDYYGWSVGYVDPTIKTLQRSFDFQNQNVYSVLCNDVSIAFRCIFTFDTANLKVNCYSVENAGTNTNIYLSLDHFLEEIDISPRNDQIYTVFNVAGGNELDISRVNFGSNKIVDIAYPLSMLGEDLRVKYLEYKETRDALRDDYAEATKDYAEQLNIEQSIIDRVPEPEVYNNWRSTIYYTLAELQRIKNNFQTTVNLIEQLYALPGGGVDYNALDISLDASKYYSYKLVCIPDITHEIAYRQSGTEYQDVDYDTVWELYGLAELENKKDIYTNERKDLTAAGYASATPSGTVNRETYTEHHNRYVEVGNYISQLTTLINSTKQKYNTCLATQEALLDEMEDLSEQSELEYYIGTLFTESDVKTIKNLYRESDYQNENILLTEIDDEISTVVKSDDLYEDAVKRLEIESVPQFTWTISSANLLAMKEFHMLKDQLQVGNFVNLYYGGSTFDPTVIPDTYRISEGGDYRVTESGTAIATDVGGWTGRFVSGRTLKFRIIEIDFDALNTTGTFNVVFTDMTHTRTYRNDLESLLGSMVSSQANSISAGVTATATSAATIAAASIIRPYVEILNAKIAQANIDSANVIDLNAINAHVQNLIADYIEADELVASIINAHLIRSANGSSYWDLDSGEISLQGFMIRTEVEYCTGSSRTVPPSQSDPDWSTSTPQTTASEPYIWMRTVMILDGNPPQRIPSSPACISGDGGGGGESPIYIQLSSSAGDTFKHDMKNTRLTCTVWKGINDITSTITSFKWMRADETGTIDTSWTRTTSVNYTDITSADFAQKAVFSCEVSTGTT